MLWWEEYLRECEKANDRDLHLCETCVELRSAIRLSVVREKDAEKKNVSARRKNFQKKLKTHR